MGDEVAGSCLGHADHEIIEFKNFGVIRKRDQQNYCPGFKTANLKLLRELVSKLVTFTLLTEQVSPSPDHSLCLSFLLNTGREAKDQFARRDRQVGGRKKNPTAHH